MPPRPPRTAGAHACAISPLPKPAKISTKPPTNAHIPTISVSTSAVGPGQTSATTPPARVDQAEQQVADDRPGLPAAEGAHCLEAGVHERVDREQDDQGENRHPGPGQGDDPGDEGQEPRRIKEFDTDLNMVMVLSIVSALEPLLRPGTASRTPSKPAPPR